MSCHSTPGNLAVLGYCAGSFGLDAESVESEFHWLKRIARDRQVPPPSQEEWQAFCDRQATWVAHDERLSDVRRGRLTSRLDVARAGETPDAATFYALQNLPSRLSYVTDAATVRGTMGKVQQMTDRLAKTGHADPDHLREVVLNLRRAEAVLTRQPAPDPADLPDATTDLIDEATEVTEMLDIYLSTSARPEDTPGQATSEHLYQAHRWIASALRRLKRV